MSQRPSQALAKQPTPKAPSRWESLIAATQQKTPPPAPSAAASEEFSQEPLWKEEAPQAAAAPEPVEEKGDNQVLTVSDLNSAIRGTLEKKFQFFWVQGEISNFKAHTSGHLYLALKDEKSQISAVMFRQFASRLKFKPQDGMEVLVRGRVTVYEPRGNYQVFIEQMEPVGEGALRLAFEQLKTKLQQEGLFEASRKRPLPEFPQHIALVTSPTGAAIRDMINVLSRRYRGARLTVFPCRVQGETAKHEIVEALSRVNLYPSVDVVILGRGGGSAEDLWAFNEEIVARAVASCQVPVISAVGHEVDFTISDFVADLRAPTPSAAAELVVKNSAEVCAHVLALRDRLERAQKVVLRSKQQQFQVLRSQLVDPARRLQDLMIRNDELHSRLQRAFQDRLSSLVKDVGHLRLRLKDPRAQILQRRQDLAVLTSQLERSQKQNLKSLKDSLAGLAGSLHQLSPLATVARGYALVTDEAGHLAKDAVALQPGTKVDIQLAKGRVRAQVEKVLSTDPVNPKKKSEGDES